MRFFHFFLIGFFSISISFSQCVEFGCMDSSAFNYSPSANCDDGSCIAVVEGCMLEEALNYNSEANTDDGSWEGA
tara:strand:- start:278 stop:502 length:225 start_codon:yes stop_codon:yes gene_type:complete